VLFTFGCFLEALALLKRRCLTLPLGGLVDFLTFDFLEGMVKVKGK
jgi:hypothetical protein